MESVSCPICVDSSNIPIFTKPSGRGEPFTLVRCARCGLRFLDPRPDENDIAAYYEREYFTTRTDRGYDNYFSPPVRSEIERVIALNCADLHLADLERAIPGERRSLDIGCAAGYFVNYMRDRGWRASGVDIARDCIDFAADRLSLDVAFGNYLDMSYPHRFHLITLWATIEHLHRPLDVLRKAHDDIADDGRLYLTTCRDDRWTFGRLKGAAWRYYNFPEHLFFFSRKTMIALLDRAGFAIERFLTYGSGFGAPSSPLRRIADSMAKRWAMGDMMLLSARKK
ncbi:MAG TPA: class I SAM-dependent methyltransferase [Spirochaetota bacterium]|nr:class I SAM-dependent methyltransferase [Spirochaetota bacterium]HNT10537.1 class I SAM-dependent methyltransferase [Spirochaetota bacterium]